LDVHDEEIRAHLVEPALAVQFVLEALYLDWTVVSHLFEVLLVVLGRVPSGDHHPVAFRRPVEVRDALVPVGDLAGVAAPFHVVHPHLRPGAVAAAGTASACLLVLLVVFTAVAPVLAAISAVTPVLRFVLRFVLVAADGQFDVLVAADGQFDVLVAGHDRGQFGAVGAPLDPASVRGAGETVGVTRPVGRDDEHRTPSFVRVGGGLPRDEGDAVAVWRDVDVLCEDRLVVEGLSR
jgi:hypothetical protein